MSPVCTPFLPLPHPHLLLVGKVPKIIVEPASLLAKIDPGRDTSCSKPSPQFSVLSPQSRESGVGISPDPICQPCARSVPVFCHSPTPHLLLVGKAPKIIVEPASLLAKIDSGRGTC